MSRLICSGLAKRQEARQEAKAKESILNREAEKAFQKIMKEKLKFKIQTLVEMQRKHFYETYAHCSVVVTVVFENGQTNVASGIIISENGFILTSMDNMADEGVDVKIKSTSVTLYDGTKLPTVVAYQNIKYDLALLKVAVKKCGLGYVRFPEPNSILVGMDVFMISHPANYNFSFLTGVMSYACSDKSILSKFGETIEDFSPDACFIQTNVPIANGSSGGAFLNWDGELIGIAILNCGSLGMGIHINTIIEFMESYKKRLETRHSKSALNQLPTFGSHHRNPTAASHQTSSTSYPKSIRGKSVAVKGRDDRRIASLSGSATGRGRGGAGRPSKLT